MEHSTSEIKRLTQELNQLRQQIEDLQKYYLTVENAFDGIVITDPSGSIVYANLAFESLSGYSRSDLLGKTTDLWELGTTGSRKKEPYEQPYVCLEPLSYETTNRTATGGTYSANVRCAPVLSPTGELLFFVLIVRDITQEKEIDLAKTEFVSLASHQLRTPLTAINWYTTMLVQNEVGPLLEAQLNYLRKIDFSAKRMTELVNALLDNSRIELGKMAIELKPTQLIEVARGVLSELSQPINAKQLQLVTHFSSDLPTVLVDPKLIRIILQNLLTNAVKYTPEKGTVTVSIVEGEENIRLTVEDTGFGIPEQQKKKIFTKLFRADNIKEHDTDGNGLGLYLVKMIIDKAGGDISFTSTEHVGSCFTVHIPRTGWRESEGTTSSEHSPYSHT